MRSSSHHNGPQRSGARGLSLVELLVALALGLVLVVGVATVYLFTKTAFNRHAQLSTLQQGVRTAFEYLGNDVRMVGHLGCFTNSGTALPSDLPVDSIKTNFQTGIEGFDYDDGGTAFPMTSDNPADETAATKWRTNVQGTDTKKVPLAALGGGLTPGSDVLVIRTVVGQPIRLRADTTTAATAVVKIEGVSGGTCIGSGAAKVSGFCTGSYGLIANCTTARAFSVASIATSDITPVDGGKTYPVFPSGSAEVFPLQTVIYYVKRSINHPGTTSLYRKIFNGDPADGTEQELIEDVESLQVQYGADTTTPNDGTVDSYIRAHEVSSPDWANIVTVRMSLLLRSATPVQADLAGALAASGAVNGREIKYPAGSRYDRRVFTTTVAIRNRIAYF